MSEGCTRSHPHENMDAWCELKAELAKARSQLAEAREDAERLEIQRNAYRDQLDPLGFEMATKAIDKARGDG